VFYFTCNHGLRPSVLQKPAVAREIHGIHLPLNTDNLGRSVADDTDGNRDVCSSGCAGSSCWLTFMDFYHCNRRCRHRLHDSGIHTLCRRKTRHIVFDDRMNRNRPITIIFGTLITQTISHVKVVLFSHLTYFMQLSYFGNLSDHENYGFGLKSSNCRFSQWYSADTVLPGLIFYFFSRRK